MLLALLAARTKKQASAGASLSTPLLLWLAGCSSYSLTSLLLFQIQSGCSR
jgi:hypothetical protein